MMTFRDAARDAIHASGGRLTSQRELLLDLLAEHDAGIDAERLHQLASAQDPTISLPTVYRTLHTLEAVRLIVSNYTSSDHDRKQYRVNDDQDRFHFTCRRCGRVTMFRSALVAQLKQELAAQLDAQVLTVCICAGGLCSTCGQEDTP
ncbi:MAG: transcriptional repressor [Anaerolineae bacterium]|nr:transcriptional repressor [Anaerolineae bacterium]